LKNKIVSLFLAAAVTLSVSLTLPVIAGAEDNSLDYKTSRRLDDAEITDIAEGVTADGFDYWVFKIEGAPEIYAYVYYFGEDKDLVFPGKVAGYGVTEIAVWEKALTSIDVSACTELEYLEVYDNKLTSIDLSKNTKLEWLDLENNRLTSLDVSKNPNLHYIDVRGNYFASEADIIGLKDNTSLYFDPQNSGFFDVAADDWFAKFADFVVANGYMTGLGKFEFGPDAQMTRGMLATVLYSSAGKPAAPAANPFSDVSAEAWFANAVKWAFANGVVSGTSGTTFSPGDNITREQIAAILYKYAEKYLKIDVSSNAELTFTDKGDISDYAVNAVKWCVSKGIISGYPDGTFLPLNQATRAEVAAMLYRFDAAIK
jgi:hypothetical protein